MNLQQILKAAYDADASDVHLIAGQPPVTRVNQVMQPMELPVISPQVARQFFLLARHLVRRRTVVEVTMGSQHRAEQSDWLVRRFGQPVPCPDPVADQGVDVARCPTVLGRLREDPGPRGAGPVPTGPRGTLLVRDPPVCQGEPSVVRGWAPRSGAATGANASAAGSDNNSR